MRHISVGLGIQVEDDITDRGEARLEEMRRRRWGEQL